MDEHHWEYRPSTHSEGIASGYEDKLKATTETPAPSICALRDGVWCHVVGPWVAEEMLRLAAENERLKADAAAADLRLATMEDWLIDKCDQPAAALRLTVIPRDLVAREVRRILCLPF